MCVLGKRLLRIPPADCYKNGSGVLHNMFCPNGTQHCDPYYESHDVKLVQGIKGLSSGVILGTFHIRKKLSKIKIVNFRQYLR